MLQQRDILLCICTDGIKGKFYSTKDFQTFFDKMPKYVSNLFSFYLRTDHFEKKKQSLSIYY
jgi:hypothetical protein